MNIVVSGRQIQISNHLEEYIQQKAQKLGNHMPTLGEVRVEVTLNETRAETDRFACQLTTWVEHHMLNAESSAADVHKAITDAVAKLDRQLGRIKMQHQHKGRPSLATNSEQALDNMP
ncbi:MAG TPA: ribosome-associated translation inhibitor RaiA [Caldilineaceae bacterium]|nr:ribosome-associated translation inhibitor RaiA [Caldilineaceae bacterium]